MKKSTLGLFSILFLLCANSQAETEVSFLNKAKINPPGLPFSEAVRVGDILFMSGQIGIQPESRKLASGGIEGETAQIMKNIQTVLKANDLDMKDVVKCTVMLADISEWGRFNKEYVKWFDAPYPARSAFAASGLAMSARAEVECIAAFSK